MNPGVPDIEPAAAARQVIAEDQRVPLRLTASRGSLGLELYEPVELGPIAVTALALTLPGLRFPLDLSGGVPKFRHRRGELEQMTITAALPDLERWASRRVGNLLGPMPRPLSVWAIPGGLSVGVLGSATAIAFDLLWAPDRGDARFVVANPRGVGLEVPALAFAMRLVGTIFGHVGERRGRVLRIGTVGQQIGRILLPAVGARAPGALRVAFGALSVREQRLSVTLDSSIAVADLGVEVTRALELSELTAEADELLTTGNADAARRRYVTILERAPRHPEIVRLIAEIDVQVSGRAEAALGLLTESLPATQAGVVGAELLSRVGDVNGARQAISQAALHEPFAPLAALCWLRLAALEPELPIRADWLDKAVARAPGLPEARWARFEARLSRGDIEGALSDAEHLEALQTGARARHDVCRAAARSLLDHGHLRDAGRLFERALRYFPDDATATAGLARALLLAGRPKRALVLFERAVELSERGGRPEPEALIDLAKVLAEQAKDLPQAIVRLRQVAADSARLIEARYLEGIYRARLGDRVGASLAFGRMRDAIELSAERKLEWVAWLSEAAENSLAVEDDAIAGERYLAVALRVAPQDDALGRRYREVAALAARRLQAARLGK